MKLLCLTMALVAGFSPAFSQELTIHCIDVGWGDCTLIESPSGKNMMVDTGRPGSSSRLVAYLDSIGVSHLDYLVTTHYHEDHIGGLYAIVDDGVAIDTAYDREWYYCSDRYDERYEPVIRDIRHTISDSQVVDLGGGVAVRVVSVNGNGRLEPPFLDRQCDGDYSENDFSVAMVVECNGFQFFVGGDLSGVTGSGYTDIETSVAPEVGDVEIYRVNHHGSRFSTNQAFLDSLDPEVSIISVGGNSHGHPDTGVVRRLAETSVVYQTGDEDGNVVDGDIVIQTDCESYYTVNGDYYGVLFIDDRPTTILPDDFLLLQNHPNPFNNTTNITYCIGNDLTPGQEENSSEFLRVHLAVYNLIGQEVETLVEKDQSLGRYSIHWDASQYPSGIYYSRLQVENQCTTRKMTLLK